MKRILFVIIILLILCYFQYISINTINNSTEILQYDNPKKNLFEVILKDKLISIFTNISFDNWIYDIDFKNKNKDIIKQNLYYYTIPLCISTKNEVHTYPMNYTSIITKQMTYRRLFYIFDGVIRFLIFSSTQEKYLYTKNNKSPINLWNQDLVKYPLINKAKYIEVICRPNTMIYIPYKFYYTIVCDTDATFIDLHSESVFSTILKKK
tara:strand:+ start:4827 stop:5453 length:627 start_codon:yes stop_codon:yes gene_type:complete